MKIAAAGRHKGLSTVYIKHNLFHQSRLGRDIELQNTHIVLFKSPTDVLQINTLSQQLGLRSPKTVDSLRYSTNSGSTPSLFFLPQSRQQITFLNDEHTTSLCSDRVPEIFPELQNKFSQKLSQRLHPVSKRVHSKPSQRRAKRNSKQEVLKFREEIHLLIFKKNKSQ